MSDVIDMSVVNELLAMCDEGDAELFVDLVDMFLVDGPARVETILAGQQTGDFDRVEQAAHSLKGSAGNLGASAVQDLSEGLQIASRRQDAPAIARMAADLPGCFAAAEAALRALANRYR